jgi:hypothetical protein
MGSGVQPVVGSHNGMPHGQKRQAEVGMIPLFPFADIT